MLNKDPLLSNLYTQFSLVFTFLRDYVSDPSFSFLLHMLHYLLITVFLKYVNKCMLKCLNK